MPRFCGLDYRTLYNIYLVVIVILTIIDLPLIKSKIKRRQKKVEEAYLRVAKYIQNTYKNGSEAPKFAENNLIFIINDRLGTIDKKIAENGRILEEIRKKLQYEIIDPEEKHKIVEKENLIQKDTDRLKMEEAKINEMLQSIDKNQEIKEIVKYSHLEILVLNVILIFLAYIIPTVEACFAPAAALLVMGLIVLSGFMTWRYLIKERQ
jgi:hypothetical protein